MKVYGFLSKTRQNEGVVWMPGFMMRNGDKDGMVVDFDSAPEAYTGRDMFTYVHTFNGKKVDGKAAEWIDTYRLTRPTKTTPNEFFSRNGYSVIAHKLCGLGMEPIAVILGDSEYAFSNLKLDGIVRTREELLAFYDNSFPVISIAKSGNTLTATTSSNASLYWETDGGYLSKTKTVSGESVTLKGADPGVKVSVGFKNFDTLASVVV